MSISFEITVPTLHVVIGTTNTLAAMNKSA
jgi:hypothetical protein